MTPGLIVLAVLLTVSVIMSSPWWCPLLWNWVRERVTVEGQQEREIRKMLDLKVDLLCSLLREDGGWVIGQYYATHPDLKFSVWIANKDYGIKVNDTGREASSYQAGNWSLKDYHNKQIWEAFCSRGTAEKAAADDLESLITRVQKYQEKRK
jgi:hypothetical protein